MYRVLGRIRRQDTHLLFLDVNLMGPLIHIFTLVSTQDPRVSVRLLLVV